MMEDNVDLLVEGAPAPQQAATIERCLKRMFDSQQRELAVTVQSELDKRLPLPTAATTPGDKPQIVYMVRTYRPFPVTFQGYVRLIVN